MAHSLAFTPTIESSSKAPPRRTQPASAWRKIFEGMGQGDWFRVPKDRAGAIRNAAVKYVRGRYTMYADPENEGDFIFLRTK